MIHPHILFESLGYAVAFLVYVTLRRQYKDSVPAPVRWALIAAAVLGAAFGSRILYWFEDPALTLRNLHNPDYVIGGKTVVGALAGGLLVVELAKRSIRLRQSTGDLYAIPLAIGIAIGRVGCFLTGLADNTYGSATNLPWAINFGDGIPRHPTQLYELIFLIALIPVLYRIGKTISTRSVILSDTVAEQSQAAAHPNDPADPRIAEAASANFPGSLAPESFLPGDAFKVFMVCYMMFRLLCDFLKPYPRLLFGLGGIQWACILLLLYYFPDIKRWTRMMRSN